MVRIENSGNRGRAVGVTLAVALGLGGVAAFGHDEIRRSITGYELESEGTVESWTVVPTERGGLALKQGEIEGRCQEFVQSTPNIEGDPVFRAFEASNETRLRRERVAGFFKEKGAVVAAGECARQERETGTPYEGEVYMEFGCLNPGELPESEGWCPAGVTAIGLIKTAYEYSGTMTTQPEFGW